jgi:hypothetical protein
MIKKKCITAKQFFKCLHIFVRISKLEDYLPGNFQFMIPTDNKTKLVKIYCYVCEQYALGSFCEKAISGIIVRIDNNNRKL